SGRAVQVGHVYEHLVDLFRGEDLLGLCPGRERCEIRRPGSLGYIVDLGMRIGPGDQRMRKGCADFLVSAEAGNSTVCRRVPSRYAHCPTIFFVAPYRS